MVETRPRGVGPVITRSATRHRPIRDPSSRDRSRRCSPRNPSSRDLSCRRAISAVVAQAAPVAPRPCTRRRPTLYPSSGVAYPSSPVFFKLPYPSSRVAEPSSPAIDPSLCAASRRRMLQTRRRMLQTRRRALRTRRCTLHTRRRAMRTRCREVHDPSSQPFPCPPRTRPRAPYKYARILLFPRTLSEHSGLHLPRRLLAGFSKGCFTFFIAHHPPRLEFREYSAVHSARINLDYIEIKHYFFFSLGLLALG